MCQGEKTPKFFPNFSLDNISSSDIESFPGKITRLFAERKKGRGEESERQIPGGGDTMAKRLLFFAIVLAGVVIMGAGLVQRCPAGETIVFHAQHINAGTRFDTFEAGDQRGHIIAYFQAKGVGIRREGPPEPFYKIDLSGTADFRADGTGTEHGFGKFTFSDGSTFSEEWTSTIGSGRDIGTAVYYNGTGRFAGIKGGSKFDCLLMGDRFVCEVDGRIELP